MNDDAGCPPKSDSAPGGTSRFFDNTFSEKERKNLFLYVVVAIVLLEFAVTVGAVVYSIANAQRSVSGMMRFNFPWIGYLVMATLVPVLVLLVLHLVSLGLSRGAKDSASDGANLPEGSRTASFFALVRGAPTIILFAAFVVLGAAVYYLDGVMALLLKLGDSFESVAIWIVGALAAAACVNIVARAVFSYKTRQMDAEYAFRREVLERTGTILLDARLAPTTDLRKLSPAVDVRPIGSDAENGASGGGCKALPDHGGKTIDCDSTSGNANPKDAPSCQ